MSNQFADLLEHVDAGSITSPFSDAMPDIHNFIIHRWQDHVNKPTALACAWFSFDERARTFDSADLTSMKQWFIDFAVIHAKQYKLCVQLADDIIRGRLENLWGQFTGRAVGSAFAGFDSNVGRIKKAQLTESARVIGGQLVDSWNPTSVWRSMESEVPLY